MDRIKLLKITERDPELKNLGFSLAKECGQGSRAFVLSVTLGYIEALILSQGLQMTNFVFLYSIYKDLDPQIYPVLKKLFDQIAEKTANHNEFVRSCKENQDVLNEVILFAEQELNIGEGLNFNEICERLKRISFQLNLQFVFYEEKIEFLSIKNNSCINALVINILIRNIEEICFFYVLYHQNYLIISEANLNLSHEFLNNNYQDSEEVRIENEIRKIIDGAVKSKKILRVNKESLEDTLKVLEQFSQLGHEIRNKISTNKNIKE